MAKENVAKKTQQRIKEMTEKRAAELAAIQKKEQEARTNLEAAEMAIHDATERTDLEAFNKGKKDKQAAASAIEMYHARYNQLHAEEFMSEAESDRVIDSLLSYEEELAEEYAAAVAGTLAQLSAQLKDYRAAVREAEDTIRSWTSNIHANYRAQGTTYANGTNRADRPQPVRITQYSGSGLSQQVASFLEKQDVAALIK